MTSDVVRLKAPRERAAAVFGGSSPVIESLESRRLFHATPGLAGDAIPHVTLVATDRIAGEDGPDTGTFRVSRSGDTSAPLLVNLIVGGTATNGIDYGVIGPDLIIPAGASSTAFLVRPAVDARIEPRESITVTLAAAAAYEVDPVAGAATVVLNDLPLPVVSIETTDHVASEAGRNTGAYRVSRAGGDLAQPLLVNFIVGGTATNGVDYGVIGPALAIPAGQSSTTFRVTAVADAKFEPRESITVTLGNTGGYAISPTNPAATMVIHDAATAVLADIGYFSVNVNFQPYDADEPPPRYVVDGGASFKRHPSGLTYGWNRSKTADPVDRHSPRAYDQRYDTLMPMDADDVWSVAVPNGSYLVHVVAGDPDGSDDSDTVLRMDVEGVRTIDRVTTGSNPITDGTRIIDVTDGVLTISSASGANNNQLLFLNLVQLSDDAGRGLGFPLVTFSDSHADASEPGNDGEWEVRRTGPIDEALIVSYTVSGTATPGDDFIPFSGSITIPAGLASTKLTLEIINDSVPEPSETVAIRLLAGPGYLVDGDIDGACLIIDTD